MKKIIICIMIIGLIILTFYIPNILFSVQDLKSKEAGYIKQEKSRMIDVKVKEIYLVKAINDIDKGNLSVKIENKPQYVEIMSRTDEDIKNVKLTNLELELKKLEDANVLKNILSHINEKKYNISKIKKDYEDNSTLYTIERSNITNDNYGITIEREKKTGKILELTVPINKLADYDNKKEILENYIKYLDLYIIDDWKYEDKSLKSEKAGLTVSLLCYSDEIAMLFIHSTDKYYQISN